MDSSTQYPFGLFGTAEQAMRRLHNAGVDPKSFLQRLIDEPEFVERIVRVCKTNVYDKLPNSLNPSACSSIVWSVLGVRNISSEEHERFASEPVVRELLGALNERQLSIILMRYGIVDGETHTIEDVAQAHSIAKSTAHRSVQKSLAKMRRKANEMIFPENMEKIESLGLSERAKNCLRRHKINTVSELIMKRGIDLFDPDHPHAGIVNFGPRSLDDVRYRLAMRGLTLKDETMIPEQIILQLSSVFDN